MLGPMSPDPASLWILRDLGIGWRDWMMVDRRRCRLAGILPRGNGSPGMAAPWRRKKPRGVFAILDRR